MIAPTLLRHLEKAAGLIIIFLLICGVAALAVIRLSAWILAREGKAFEEHPSYLSTVSRAFNAIARRRRLAVLLVILACLFVRGMLIPILKVPAPYYHDEFSYLLAADTFAHGRLTNPTPAMWEHMESMHILLRPTYMSMYPPGQGMMLAVGQKLGNPWLSVWIMAALMCGAICWALQAWMPPRWALLGGVIAILQFGVLSYWVNTYFCASLPAFAGALALGSLPRLRRGRQMLHAFLLAVGIAILALTRPYEGLIFAVPIAIAIALLVRERGLRDWLARIFVPMLIMIGSTLAFQGYYNWRVVGNPLVMPYQVNQRTYAVVPMFLWQHLRPVPVYRNETLRQYYAGWEVKDYRSTVGPGLVHLTEVKFWRLWLFYFGPFLSIALVCLPCSLRDERPRLLWIVLVSTLAGLEIEVWAHPHYAAPITVVFVALTIQGLRHLGLWRWRGRRIGSWLAVGAVAACFFLDAAWISAVAVRVNDYRLYNEGNLSRASILNCLRHTPGQHLVIVHYAPNHYVHEEWVYNRADLEHAKVIWARDMGETANRELFRYFPGRYVWTVQADHGPPELQAYPHAGPALPTTFPSVCSDVAP